MRYTPWVVSEHVPDFSTLDNLVNSPRFAGKTGQELAIALWQAMVDHDLGIFHYFPAQELPWHRDTFDPLKVFNVYGFTICHVHAHVLGMLCRAAGFESRIANIRGHEGTEVFYDGKWHYYDADIQMFHRLRPPDEDTVASREDTYRDPTLVSDQPNPSFPYHLPDRLPESFAQLYESPPEYPDLLEEQLHSMDYRLRPGEEMVRYFHNRGRWVVFPYYPQAYARWPGETGPEGPTERFWPRRQWGNGYFRYAPRLSKEFRDLELGADAVEGLSQTADGLVCKSPAGSAIFAFESPYIYCGVPDPMGRAPSVSGALLAAGLELPQGASARVEGAPGLSDQWQVLWSSEGRAGKVDCKLDFTSLADGRYRLRLRVVLEGKGATLRDFETRMWFMVSPHSLPTLRNAGENRMCVHGGDRHGLNTRTIAIDSATDDENWAGHTFATANLRHDPTSWKRLTPEDPSRPWEATYELSAPGGGMMAWLSTLAIVEGRKPEGIYDGTPAKIEIADSPDGPWEVIAQREIVVDPNGWHFAISAQGRLSGRSPNAYVRFSAKHGANGFRLVGHYVPPGDPPAALLEIEHFWYEVDPRVGRRLKSHRHVTNDLACEYVVRCDNEPHDERIEMRVPSLKR